MWYVKNLHELFLEWVISFHINIHRKIGLKKIPIQIQLIRLRYKVKMKRKYQYIQLKKPKKSYKPNYSKMKRKKLRVRGIMLNDLAKFTCDKIFMYD